MALDYTALDATVAKFRKASPNIAAAFDQVKALMKQLDAADAGQDAKIKKLEEAEPPPIEPPPVTPPPSGGWPPILITPPAFTPYRTVNVTSLAQFQAAMADLRAGDRVTCSGFTITGQLNLHHQLAAPAEIHFGTVKLAGGGASDLNSIWIKAKNLRLFGGICSNPTGHGILFYESSDILWHGFKVAAVGGCCLRVFAVAANVDRLDLQGEVSDCGHDLTLDAHGKAGGEYGSGLHPTYVGGGDPALPWKVRDSRFVIDSHDCATGSNQIGPKATGCEFYFRAKNLTFQAKSQTGGNAVQLFGGASNGDHDIWVEADNVAQVVRVSNEAFQPIRVNHGRGTNVRGNYDSKVAYMPNPAVTYRDCT